MKKAAAMLLVLTLLVVAILGESEFISTSIANPYHYYLPYPSSPNVTPPTITLLTPLEGQVFNLNNFTLGFSLNKPESWFLRGINEDYANAEINGTCGCITWLSLTLDGIRGLPSKNITGIDSEPIYGGSTPRNLEFAATLNGLSNGTHSIEISAGGRCHYYYKNYSDYTIFEGRIYYNEQYKYSTTTSEILKASFTVVTNVQFRFTEIDITPITATPLTITAISLENKTFNSHDVPLNFRLSKSVSHLSYILDNQTTVAITGNTLLTGLSDGTHSIVLVAYAFGNTVISKRILFTIDTTAPEVRILNPENKTYHTHSIPMNFAVNEDITSASCSLDGQNNMTFQGNTTLSDLAEGSHVIVVYVNDTVGNTGVSETVLFSVAGSFPTLSVVGASVSSVAVAAVVVLVCFKRHRRGTK